MTSELEGSAEGPAAAVPDEASGAAEATAQATGDGTTAEATTAEASGAATAEGTGSAGTAAAAVALPATAHPAAPAAEEAPRDTSPPPPATPTTTPPPLQAGVRVMDALEAIKTAVVWLVVLQILTILSPLLRAPLKWSLIIALVLTLSSFAVGGVAYLKARRAQASIPE